MNDNELPVVCTMTGIRKIVLKNTWQQVKSMEAQGRPVLNRDFSDLLKKEWSTQKKEAERLCGDISQPEVFDEGVGDDALHVATEIEKRIDAGWSVEKSVKDVLENI